MGGEGPAPLLVDAVVANAARAASGRTAAVLGDTALTFADLDRSGGEVGAALRSAGVGAGDLVIVLGTVSLDLAAVFAGCARIGAVFAPVDPRSEPSVLAAVVERVEPSVIVSAEGWHDVGEGLAAATLVGHRDAASLIGGLALAATDRPGSGLDERDPHIVYFTSGSTGVPKGVVVSNRASVLRSHPGSQLEVRGPLVCPYPLFHMAGWTLSMQQWHARAPVVYVPGADPAAIIDAVVGHAASRLNAIPGVWQRILDHLDAAGQPPLDSLRFADTGTYATPPELLAAITAAAPRAHVRVFYGSTEAGNVTGLDHGDIVGHPGSCGVESPLVELRLSHLDELQVRSAALFDGYLNDPAATADAFEDGWFRTGDVAGIADGFVSIIGRLGQLIRTGGESVSPARVETVLASHPGLADIGVVGVPDPRWGEVVCAALVVAEGVGTPTLAELRAHATGLAPHEVPRRLAVVAEIPRTRATGQVDRRALRALVDEAGPDTRSRRRGH